MRLFAGLLALACLAPGSAEAYVRARNRIGAQTYWSGGCVFLAVSEGGSRAIGDLSTMSALRAAVGNWMSRTASCSYLDVKLSEITPLEGIPMATRVAPHLTHG